MNDKVEHEASDPIKTEFTGWTEDELRSVIKSAGIELFDDGGFGWKPKAVKHYCEQHTAERNAQLLAETLRLRQALEHYADERRWLTAIREDGTRTDGKMRYYSMSDNGYDIAQAALGQEAERQ